MLLETVLSTLVEIHQGSRKFEKYPITIALRENLYD